MLVNEKAPASKASVFLMRHTYAWIANKRRSMVVGIARAGPGEVVICAYARRQFAIGNQEMSIEAAVVALSIVWI